MSYSQVAIMDYASRKTPKEIIEIFVQKIEVFLMQVFIYDQHLPI